MNWEYKIIKEDINSPLGQGYLNSLGEEGWELCAVPTVENPERTRKYLQFIFKRLRDEVKKKGENQTA